MNRRDMIKAIGATVVLGAVSVQAKEEEPYFNRYEMKPENPNKLTKDELKHTPLITLKEKDEKGYTAVEITVGQGGIIHPSTKDHWIDFIELYADSTLVGKNVLEGEISRGLTLFGVKLEGVKKLTAKAGCNLHGIWSSELTL
ncbi:MAG: twin-arginine translocation pathway signal protein [Campylobacterales bacterium]|nr:twin-arginine translocation pathway signal protein [Campylobacterales bacterium]